MKKECIQVSAEQFIKYMEAGKIPENLCVTERVHLEKRVFSRPISLGNTLFKSCFSCSEATFTGNFNSTNMQLIKSFQLWYTTDKKLQFNWLNMN